MGPRVRGPGCRLLIQLLDKTPKSSDGIWNCHRFPQPCGHQVWARGSGIQVYDILHKRQSKETGSSARTEGAALLRDSSSLAWFSGHGFWGSTRG